MMQPATSQVREVALMRRLLLVLALAAVMAAMLMVMAAPAMAQGAPLIVKCGPPEFSKTGVDVTLPVTTPRGDLVGTPGECVPH